MADLNFPSTPQIGDTFTVGSRTWVWNGTAWQLQTAIQSLDPFTVKTLIVTSSTNSTSTNSGALIVEGGVGIGGDLWIGGILYSGGAAVLTTSTFFDNLSEGDDIQITTGTNNSIFINNTSTLQTVTTRGSTTTNAVRINNVTNSTSTTTGALIVEGGVGIGERLFVGESIQVGTGSGSAYGDNNLISTYAESAYLNLKGGSRKSKISIGDDELFFVSGNSPITFGIGADTSTSSGTEVLRITPELNVGIGISNPNSKLDVDGTVSITGITTITNLTSATNTMTGALQISGGVSVGDNLYINGHISFYKLISNPVPVSVNSTTVPIDSFDGTLYRSAKYFISISNISTNKFQTSEIWLVHDGTIASIEQTSVFTSGTDYVVTFSTDISGNTVSLLATGILENNTVKMQTSYITT